VFLSVFKRIFYLHFVFCERAVKTSQEGAVQNRPI
jgi:hypothetical protein